MIILPTPYHTGLTMFTTKLLRKNESYLVLVLDKFYYERSVMCIDRRPMTIVCLASIACELIIN